jgi:hypothetical protein
MNSVSPVATVFLCGDLAENERPFGSSNIPGCTLSMRAKKVWFHHLPTVGIEDEPFVERSFRPLFRVGSTDRGDYSASRCNHARW